MTTSSPASRSQSQRPLPNQPFFSWLRTQTGLFIGQIIGLLGTVSIPIALFYYSMHSLPEHFEWQKLEKLGYYVIYAHLLFLVLFIAFLIRRLDKNDVGAYRARLVHEKLKGNRATNKEFDSLQDYSTNQVGRFKRRFLLFWCSMLGLYLIFAVEPLVSGKVADCLQVLNFEQLIHTQTLPFLSFALNNISLMLVFTCFSVLYLPTPAKFSGPVPPPEEDAPQKSEP